MNNEARRTANTTKLKFISKEMSENEKLKSITNFRSSFVFDLSYYVKYRKEFDYGGIENCQQIDTGVYGLWIRASVNRKIDNPIMFYSPFEVEDQKWLYSRQNGVVEQVSKSDLLKELTKQE